MPPNGDVMPQCRRSKPHYYITGTSNDTTSQLILWWYNISGTHPFDGPTSSTCVEIMSYQMMQEQTTTWTLEGQKAKKKKLTWIGHQPPEEALWFLAPIQPPAVPSSSSAIMLSITSEQPQEVVRFGEQEWWNPTYRQQMCAYSQQNLHGKDCEENEERHRRRRSQGRRSPGVHSHVALAFRNTRLSL